MDVQEALQLLERLRREREELEGSYTDVIHDLEGTPIPDNPLKLYRWLHGITVRLSRTARLSLRFCTSSVRARSTQQSRIAPRIAANSSMGS